MGLKIATLNRGRDTHPGGDMVHLDSLSEALGRYGVTREHKGWHDDLSSYDLIHCHHINFDWSEANYMHALKFGKPIVLTTIFYDSESWLPFKQMKTLLLHAAAVVTYSLHEEAVIRMRTLFQGRVHVIPPGVGQEFFHPWTDQEREGVLTVAARSGDKGCAAVEAACRLLDIPYQQAIGVSRQDLPALYKKAKVFVNNSGHESFGLTILEGLVAGCRVLATSASWALEHFPGIMPIDPQSKEGLEAALWLAYKSDVWDYTPNQIAETMTWDEEARSMKSLYERVLDAHRTDN